MATPFISTVDPTSANLRSDFNGKLGFKFTVGGSSITVSQLGRWKISGNSGTHAVAILDASSNVIVSANVDLSTGSAGTFVWATIADTVLSASTDYFCTSSEANGGDQWYDPNSNNPPYAFLTTTADATILNAAYESGTMAASWTGVTGYVPPNMMIGAGPAPSGNPWYAYDQYRRQ